MILPSFPASRGEDPAPNQTVDPATGETTALLGLWFERLLAAC